MFVEQPTAHLAAEDERTGAMPLSGPVAGRDTLAFTDRLILKSKGF